MSYEFTECLIDAALASGRVAALFLAACSLVAAACAVAGVGCNPLRQQAAATESGGCPERSR